MGGDGEENRKDRYIRRLLDNRLVAPVAAIGAVVIAIGALTGALGTIVEFLRPGPNPRTVQEYCELLAPLEVQFDRTLAAFNQYRARDFAVEETLINGNQLALDLLSTKAQLVPRELVSARDSLIYHYDRWLEEYNRVRRFGADSIQAYIFVGPQGAGFPRHSEARFRARADSARLELGSNFVCG